MTSTMVPTWRGAHGVYGNLGPASVCSFARAAQLTGMAWGWLWRLRSPYRKPLKTDMAFIGRFASKSVLANLYDKE